MSVLTGRRVLVVDDETLIALFAEELLLSAGATPIGPASSLEEALATIDGAPVDAVLLDVNLNGKSSEPVGRVLMERQIPFVVVTGYGRVAWAEGVARVIAKPYTAGDVLAALEQAIALKSSRVLGAG